MHQSKIIHRDLKLENVLLNSKEDGVLDVRIADFGLAAELNEDEILHKKCGTPSYIAPEVLSGSGYSFQADVFSIGSMMYNLASGLFLFSGDSLDSILRYNRECNLEHVPFNITHLSSLGQDLLMSLLNKDPS